MHSKKFNKMLKFLVVFDFDHTIIDGNSDIIIRKMVSQQLISEEVKQLYKTSGWTSYMQEIFKILHAQQITKESILKKCREFKETDGMISLIADLKNKLLADVIIISDSNSIFIEEWLKAKNLSKCVNEIFTNPARFEKDGLLKIEMYHIQDWCELSTKNLCKGYIMESFIKKQKSSKKYDFVAYVGDGKNDLCPTLKLQSVDLCFPRIGYALLTSLNEYQSKESNPIQAQIKPWESGSDIWKVLSQKSNPDVSENI